MKCDFVVFDEKASTLKKNTIRCVTLLAYDSTRPGDEFPPNIGTFGVRNTESKLARPDSRTVLRTQKTVISSGK